MFKEGLIGAYDVENQKQHIKNAGLNPALMYGMGGGGGVSASGAQGQGVTQPTARSVEIEIKQQGLGLQLASIASQVELNESQTEKKERKEELLSKFIQLIIKHYKETRTLDFYAEKLFISTKYMSDIIKKTSGLVS